MYHQKNGAKVRVFSEMANEITVFFSCRSLKSSNISPLSEIKQ